VMNLGEGTDAAEKKEIDRVLNSNYFKRKIVAVHGVAMNAEQAASFHGLAWCPASNYFLFGQTADIKKLKEKIKVVFGTDSTLTSAWNAWEHFQHAMQKLDLTEKDLLTMLGSNPASLWKLNDRGQIQPGLEADILVIKKTTDIFKSGPGNILLVIKRGKIYLMDESFLSQLKNPMKQFTRINIEGSNKIVKGELDKLVQQILKIYPGAEIPFKLVSNK